MKSQWCNSGKCMKAFNICIIKANVKEVPKHVTLLSQRDASSPKQEQVLSSEKKRKKSAAVGTHHVPHSYMCQLHTCFCYSSVLKSLAS